MADELFNTLELNPYVATQQTLASKGDQRLREMIAWALLSPSPHNTQPWKWSVKNGVVRLYGDYSRQLKISDPDARELTIGCGSSLEHFLLRLGLDRDPIQIDILPDTSEPECFAQVVVGKGKPYKRCPDMVNAMHMRRTNRSTYHGGPMPDGLRDLLDKACVEFGVETSWITKKSSRISLVDLIMQSDHIQMASSEFRKELFQWMRVKSSNSNDGMQVDLLGQHGLAAYLAPLIVRTFDVGTMQAAADAELMEGSPDIVVLSTTSDNPASWIATGRALACFTLTSMAACRYSSYMNQPCEVPKSRNILADLINVDGFPQLIIRLGLAEPVHRAPRKPVVDVLNGSDEPHVR